MRLRFIQLTLALFTTAAQGQGEVWTVDGGTQSGAFWTLFLDEDAHVLDQREVAAFTSGVFVNQPDRFAVALEPIGDWNGDGVPDLAVGSPRTARPLGFALLRADGSLASLQHVAPLPAFLEDSERYGSAIAAVGDLDQDGVDDLAVGAPSYGLGPTATWGAVYLTFMNADGSPKLLARISRNVGGFTGSFSDYSQFGAALHPPGDMDGDGTADLSVGSPRDQNSTGSVWFVYLDPTSLVKTQRKIVGTVGFGGFGWAVCMLDDLDGDGVRDLAVGAPDTPGGGSVWILHLNADESVKSSHEISAAAFSSPGDLGFGTSLTLIHDTNGDGLRELAVGMTRYTHEACLPGAVVVLSLDTDGTVSSHHVITSKTSGFTGFLSSSGNFARALAAPGDVDGDGRDDLIATAYDWDDGSSGLGDIQEAACHAADGDTLLIEPGSYSRPVIAGKSLSVLVLEPENTTYGADWLIRDVPTNARVSVRGVRTDRSFDVLDNEGLVWIEDTTSETYGFHVQDSAEVVLQSVLLPGDGIGISYSTLKVVDSQLFAFDCTIRGNTGGVPPQGSPAVELDGGFLYLAGSKLTGGDGFASSCAPGGPALELEGDAVLFDSVLRGGADVCTGTETTAIALGPGATVTKVPGEFLHLTSSSPVRPGESLQLSFEGPRHTPVWIGIGSAASAFYRPSSGFTSLVTQPTELLFAGVTDGAGQLTRELPIAPLPPGTDVRSLALQAIYPEFSGIPLARGRKRAQLTPPRWTLDAGSVVLQLAD